MLGWEQAGDAAPAAPEPKGGSGMLCGKGVVSPGYG